MCAERKAIYISDMGRCEPGSAISETAQHGHWRAIPYEAEGVSGTMITAGIECKAPTVTLPLEVEGWYAIHLGIWTNWVDRVTRVKLTDDPCFSTATTLYPDIKKTNYFASIGEVFWKCADLTGQALHIGQQSHGTPWASGIAYVKLEPMTPEEVTAIQEDRAGSDTKRLVAYNDAWSVFGERTLYTEEDIIEEVEPFRDTDFQKLLWGIGAGSMVQYLSEVGELAEKKGMSDFSRYCDRQAAESFRMLKERGIDPLKTVIDHAHDLGIELHGTYRVGGWVFPPPDDFENRLYRQHPEWRCVSRDGRPVARLSYAFPGVQDFVISLFREVAERGADGVNMAFIRGLPCVMYEQPIVEGFQRQHGQDPRELPEDDPEWLSYRASWMTSFMRALREEMDRVGERQGRRIQVSAYVIETLAYNLQYGLDVAAWAEEGLVDFIIPNPWHGDRDVDVASFVEVTRGTDCKVYADILPRRMPAQEYRQRALECYAAGVDGLAFWDTNSRYPFLDEWSMIRRLGHEEALQGWAADEWPAYRQVPLHSLGGHHMGSYSPYWSA